jgi:hypothetical protein
MIWGYRKAIRASLDILELYVARQLLLTRTCITRNDVLLQLPVWKHVLPNQQADKEIPYQLRSRIGTTPSTFS